MPELTLRAYAAVDSVWPLSTAGDTGSKSLSPDVLRPWMTAALVRGGGGLLTKGDNRGRTPSLKLLVCVS
jgi:hypothetical protein